MNTSLDVSGIRNFCIIAHIDHGKSTLADRMLQITGTVGDREMRDQFLDKLALERERGITIKLQAVRMEYRKENVEDGKLNPENRKRDTEGSLDERDSTMHSAAGGRIQSVEHGMQGLENMGKLSGKLSKVNGQIEKAYILNLIDTPGHIDFSYEVSRALAACEGALLLVDATQGIQAQTLANYYKAKKAGLKVIPVVNKVDLPNASPEETALELVDVLGFDEQDVVFTSGKTGEGVEDLLSIIVERISEPAGIVDGSARGLIFDSFYDQHLGVMAMVRVVDGALRAKDMTLLVNNRTSFLPIEMGYVTNRLIRQDTLEMGEVGYIATGLKDIKRVRVGDTVGQAELAHDEELGISPLPGYKEPKAMVYANLFPEDSTRFKHLRDAVEKYRLTDSAFTFDPVKSIALGLGFRCGFLGLLHLDIVRERLLREYDIDTLITSPSVLYKATTTKDEDLEIQSPEQMPDRTELRKIEEPVCLVKIFTQSSYIGPIMQLADEYRGEHDDTVFIGRDGKRSELIYRMPLAEIIGTFFDRLKSVSAGYASLDYEVVEYRGVDLVKLDLLLNYNKQETLARLVVREQAEEIGRKLVHKLKDLLPRENFKVPIQAAIGGKIVARETIPAVRKDVTAKLYGGDRTRKDKLLKKQAKGKKRMQTVGRVRIPGSVYQKILSL